MPPEDPRDHLASDPTILSAREDAASEPVSDSRAAADAGASETVPARQANTVHVRSEHYEGISLKDLHRFHAELQRAKQNVSRMPEKSNGWANAAWAILGITVSVASTTGALMVTGVSTEIITPLAVAAAFSLAIAIICGVVHRKFNKQTEEERERIVQDIERMICEVETAMIARDDSPSIDLRRLPGDI